MSASLPMPPQAADSASSASTACPMLTHLSRDVGAQFCLLRFFKLGDMAALAGCCATWAVWLNTDGATANKRRRVVKPSKVAQLLACSWVKRHIVRIDLLNEPSPHHMREAEYMMYEQQRRAALDQRRKDLIDRTFLRLAEFVHLEDLRITFAIDVITEQTFQLGLVALAPRLEMLTLDNQTHDSVQLLTKHVHLLSNLTSLVVVSENAMGFMLGNLPKLPRLAILRFTVPYDSFAVLPSHVAILARCRSLHTLDFGDFRINPSDLEGGLGRFVESRLTSTKGLAPAVPMRFLRLNRTRMTHAAWRLVSRLTSLQSLWPQAWSDDLTAEDWSRLSSFTQLQRLSINTESTDLSSAAKYAAIILPAVLRCSTLTELQLNSGMQITRDSLESIVAQLPALSFLSLKSVRLESVAPLANAASLARLRLSCCSGLTGLPCQWRHTLPALPSLTSLELIDDVQNRLGLRAAAALNRALMARMPKLTLANFQQNLCENALFAAEM